MPGTDLDSMSFSEEWIVIVSDTITALRLTIPLYKLPL